MPVCGRRTDLPRGARSFSGSVSKGSGGTHLNSCTATKTAESERVGVPGRAASADRLATFLTLQRQHPCTDCGYSPLTDTAPAEGLHFRRMTIGGGTLVMSEYGPITEVHILPHCGTELPQDLLDQLDPDQLPAIAQLVHDNADTGTGAIYHELVAAVVSGQLRGAAVAGFHLSRVLLDANRVKFEEQLPLRPYAGSSEAYEPYLRRSGEKLRKEALLPWLEAVNRILRQLDNGVAYHHHTYDLFSLSPRPWDRGTGHMRPPFQLVWQKPTNSLEIAGPPGTNGLTPLEEIRLVRDNIAEYLRRNSGLADCDGDIDFPLTLPVVPYWGADRADPPEAPRHILYDVRKDILDTMEKIRAWVTRAPWRSTVNPPCGAPKQIPCGAPKYILRGP